MPRATAWADQCDLFAEVDTDTEPTAAAEPADQAAAAEAQQARRAERLARETAELEARAERAAAHLAERRALPEVAEWRARFERAPYVVSETREGLPVWSHPTRAGWVCPSCGHAERSEDALRREHGYDPDQPGAMPYAAAEFGDPDQCHRARLLASQARARAERQAAAGDSVAESLCSGPTLARAADPDPNADPERAWLDRRYAGWVARQERRADAERAAHADPEPEPEPEDDDDDQADDAAAAEAHAAREVENWRATFRRHDGWKCPSCGTTEPTEDALRAHGYDPDQPGTMPPGVTVYGETNRCHLALIDQPAPQLGPEHAAEWPARNHGWMTERHDWHAIVTDQRGRGLAVIPLGAPYCDGPQVVAAPDGALF